MAVMRPDEMEEFLRSGVLSIEEGRVSAGQTSKLGGRRGTPLTPVDYPHRGELLQHERLSTARSKDVLPRLQEALSGAFAGIQERLPYEIGPRASEVGQFIVPRLDPDMPYTLSRLTPVIPGSPSETAEMYQRAQKFLQSQKNPATSREVKMAMAELAPFLPKVQQVVNLGLQGGPGYHAVNVNQAFRSALLLMSAATIPESAAMSVTGRHYMRRGEGSTALAREREVARRTVADLISQAKGAKGQFMGLGGPRVAEAVRMFTQLTGPLAGLRKLQDLKTGQQLTAGLPPQLLGFPEASSIFPSVEKNVKALRSYEESQEVASSVRELSAEEKAARIEARIQTVMEPEDFKKLKASIGSMENMTPFQRSQRMIAELMGRTSTGRDFAIETGNRYNNLAARVIEEVAEAPKTVKTAPSVQRMTGAVAEAGALGGMLDKEEAAKVMRKTASKMNVKLHRNTAGIVMLLGAILSTGLVAAGVAGEEAA